MKIAKDYSSAYLVWYRFDSEAIDNITGEKTSKFEIPYSIFDIQSSFRSNRYFILAAAIHTGEDDAYQ